MSIVVDPGGGGPTIQELLGQQSIRHERQMMSRALPQKTQKSVHLLRKVTCYLLLIQRNPFVL